MQRIFAAFAVFILLAPAAWAQEEADDPGEEDAGEELDEAGADPFEADDPDDALDDEASETVSQAAGEPPTEEPTDAPDEAVDEQVEEAVEEPVVDPAAEAAGDEEPGFDLSGGAYIWHYEPFLEGVGNNTELYAAWLVVNASLGDFGFYFEPRFRDSRLREYYNSNFWVQQVYAHYESPAGTLKAGKLYSQFGRFWDASFYGNVPYFDGVKLDPDVGVSLEGTQPIGSDLDVAYAAQYFVVDGLTNGSLQGRDTISVPGARQRNIVVARAAGTYRLMDPLSVTLGLSGQGFQADFAEAEDDTVFRFGADLEVARGPAKLYGEYFRQSGRWVVDYPTPGVSPETADYWQVGAQYAWGRFAPRYNLSGVSYGDGVDISEVLHQPGVTISLHDQLALMAEYVYWTQDSADYDHSMNLVFYAAF